MESLKTLLNNVFTTKTVEMPPAEIVPVTTAPTVTVVMTSDEIMIWLEQVNDDLLKIGRLRMQDTLLRGFTELLTRYNYTFDQAECATKFILFGKRNDFRTQEILPNYFFPTKDELSQFAGEFVHISEVTAQINEVKRRELIARKDVELQLQEELLKNSRLIDEIKRLNRTPRTETSVNVDSVKLAETMKEYLSTDVPALKATIKDLKNSSKHYEHTNNVLTSKISKLFLENLKHKQRLKTLGDTIEFTVEEEQLMEKEVTNMEQWKGM